MLPQELCEGGDWFKRLLSHGTYSEQQAACAMRSLLQALQYCHSLGVAHRDVKPENILYSDFSDSACIKLTDFGLSAMVPQEAIKVRTPFWLSAHVAINVVACHRSLHCWACTARAVGWALG